MKIVFFFLSVSLQLTSSIERIVRLCHYEITREEFLWFFFLFLLLKTLLA